MFIWQISARSTGMNSRNTTKMVGHKFVSVRDCHSYVDSCNFISKAISHTPEVEIHTRPKLYHFGCNVVRAKLFCPKCFVPVTGLECPYAKIFIPVTKISVAKSEISVTGPAQPLIFLQRNEWQARSRKPSQPG